MNNTKTWGILVVIVHLHSAGIFCCYCCYFPSSQVSLPRLRKFTSGRDTIQASVVFVVTDYSKHSLHFHLSHQAYLYCSMVLRKLPFAPLARCSLFAFRFSTYDSPFELLNKQQSSARANRWSVNLDLLPDCLGTISGKFLFLSS